MARRLSYHNENPSEVLPDVMPKQLAKAEFARRLNRMIVMRGWNQSELARRCEAVAPKGVKVGRDKISKYIRGLVFPSPVNLKVLCDALDCQPQDLIPNRGVIPEVGEDLPHIDVRDAGNGMTWLRINKMVKWDTAIKIQALIEKETRGAQG